MEIGIKFGITENKENKNFNIEMNILEYIIRQIANSVDKESLNIVSKCNDYTTLCYKEHDIVRLKCSDKSKWIKVFIFKENKEQYINSELFVNQKNKNEYMWKGSFNDMDDIDNYLDIINYHCKRIDLQN